MPNLIRYLQRTFPNVYIYIYSETGMWSGAKICNWKSIYNILNCSKPYFVFLIRFNVFHLRQQRGYLWRSKALKNIKRLSLPRRGVIDVC